MQKKVVLKESFDNLENRVNDNFQYSKNMSFNNSKNKIQLKLAIGADYGIDKCSALLYGSHNVEPFFAMIYVSTLKKAVIYNLVGNIGIVSEGQTDTGYAIRIGTAKYGTCSIYSTIPIVEAFFNN